jgi:hypothetical protein
VFKGLAVR